MWNIGAGNAEFCLTALRQDIISEWKTQQSSEYDMTVIVLIEMVVRNAHNAKFIKATTS